MKLVFIASLSFSGSTLLDMLLSCHPGVVGIGEIDQLIDPEKRPRHIEKTSEVQCTCGSMMNSCVLWGPYSDFIRSIETEDYVPKYKRMLDLVREQYGDEVVLADSSKYHKPLGNLLNNYEALGLAADDVTVIHLIKDVRGFVLSHKRSEDLNGMGELKKMRLWYRLNSEFDSIIAGHKTRKLQIGYEEICLYPEYAAMLICEAIGIEFNPAMTDLKKSHGHQALGNMMRLDDKKSKKIYYDNRWFSDHSISWKYLCHPRIRKYNESRVYQNTLVKQKGARFQPQ